MPSSAGTVLTSDQIQSYVPDRLTGALRAMRMERQFKMRAGTLKTGVGTSISNTTSLPHTSIDKKRILESEEMKAKRKMTREERKFDVILKAFAKLEEKEKGREARRRSPCVMMKRINIRQERQGTQNMRTCSDLPPCSPENIKKRWLKQAQVEHICPTLPHICPTLPPPVGRTSGGLSCPETKVSC
ncbi:hypothetical protein UPYG_G00346820 [Umbra pygmaea]|uniref:Uncharacterized protein n=1 Tax=Umbra pygmaea TaxID=75934 RepID=A0ABD0WJZ3_UMBPY